MGVKGWIPAGLSPGGTRAYIPKAPLPYAFVLHDWMVVSEGRPGFALLTRPGLDPRKTALVESPPPEGVRKEKGPAKAAGILLRRPGRIGLRAEGPGLLLISEEWHPGWRAVVDGKERTPVPADHAFLGLWLGPGEHRVHLSFRPDSLENGFYAAGAGLLLLLVLLAGFWLRWRGKRE